jgi:hypothetical protein
MFSAQPLEQRPDMKNYYPRHVEIHVLMKNLRNYGLFRYTFYEFNLYVCLRTTDNVGYNRSYIFLTKFVASLLKCVLFMVY